MKTCSKCNASQDDTNFFKDKGFKDGLRKTCKNCDKRKFAKWRQANHADHNASAKKWAQEHKDVCRARASQWNKDNKTIVNARNIARKKHIRQATSKWIDKQLIVEFYKNRPDGHHVDHIIPLRGENVSGLHVPWNLQYLLAAVNIAKGNRS